MHISWALVRVAKAFLETPRHDVFDLSRAAGVEHSIVVNMVARMVVEGWLVTEDGWIFEVTPTGRRALIKVLAQAKAFNDKRQGTSS